MIIFIYYSFQIERITLIIRIRIGPSSMDPDPNFMYLDPQKKCKILHDLQQKVAWQGIE